MSVRNPIAIYGAAIHHTGESVLGLMVIGFGVAFATNVRTCSMVPAIFLSRIGACGLIAFSERQVTSASNATTSISVVVTVAIVGA